MQISLSYQLFEDNLFNYLFITTHSDLIIRQIDNVNLIKLLFEYIMKNIIPKYESEGAFILTVDGIIFEEYYKILI